VVVLLLLLLLFKVDLWSATSLKWSRRDLSYSVAEHRSVLENQRVVRILVIFQDRPMFSHIIETASARAFRWCGWTQAYLEKLPNIIVDVVHARAHDDEFAETPPPHMIIMSCEFPASLNWSGLWFDGLTVLQQYVETKCTYLKLGIVAASRHACWGKNDKVVWSWLHATQLKLVAQLRCS